MKTVTNRRTYILATEMKGKIGTTSVLGDKRTYFVFIGIDLTSCYQFSDYNAQTIYVSHL